MSTVAILVRNTIFKTTNPFLLCYRVCCYYINWRAEKQSGLTQNHALPQLLKHILRVFSCLGGQIQHLCVRLYSLVYRMYLKLKHLSTPSLITCNEHSKWDRSLKLCQHQEPESARITVPNSGVALYVSIVTFYYKQETSSYQFDIWVNEIIPSVGIKIKHHEMVSQIHQ